MMKMLLKSLRLLLVALALSPFTALASPTLDLNTASAAELETLKGIGPVKAQAIIAYRDQHGPFSSVEELDQVPGIGEKMLEQVRAQVHVGVAPTAAR